MRPSDLPFSLLGIGYRLRRSVRTILLHSCRHASVNALRLRLRTWLARPARTVSPPLLTYYLTTLPPHHPLPDEQGSTAIEAAVAAALLVVVLIPLVAFASYLALENRAEAYAEALRIGERYVEMVNVSPSQEALPEPLQAAEGRFTIERTVAISGSLRSVRVYVARARTGRRVVTLERTLFIPPVSDGDVSLTRP